MSTQKTQEDLDFEAKLAKAFYKTSNKNYGSLESQCTFNVTQSRKKVKIKLESMANSLTYLVFNLAFALLWYVQEC